MTGVNPLGPPGSPTGASARYQLGLGREGLLHLPPHSNRAVRFVDSDVAPAQRLTGSHAPDELPAVRKAERKRAESERVGCRHELAHHGKAALAVEQLAGSQLAFGRSDRVGAPTRRAARGLV